MVTSATTYGARSKTAALPPSSIFPTKPNSRTEQVTNMPLKKDSKSARGPDGKRFYPAKGITEQREVENVRCDWLSPGDMRSIDIAWCTSLVLGKGVFGAVEGA